MDVVAVDAAGHPVHGLTKNDFTIVDGGVTRPIVGFAEFSRADDFRLPIFPATFRIDVADNSASRLDRIVVMVLDDLHGFGGRTGRDDRVKALARQVVDGLGPHATLALLTTTGHQRTELTTDRSRLMALIEQFEGQRRQRIPINEGTPHLTAGTDADGTEAPPAMGAPLPEKGSGGISAPVEGVLGDFFANVTTYKAIEDAARMLTAEEGRRKAFVYISEGTTMGAPTAMMEALRRAGVAIYSIDPRGNVPHGSEQMFIECGGNCVCTGANNYSCQPADSRTWVETAQAGLTSLAQQTGGAAVVNTDDFDEGIHRVLDDIENYYVLGFAPADPKAKDFRAISVRSNRPDLTLRYRRGYQLGQPLVKANANPLVALSAGALPKSELPLQAYAVPMPTGRGGARVAFWLEVRGDALPMLDSDGALHDTLRYAVIPVDAAHGKTLTGLAKVATVLLRPKSKAKAEWPTRVVYQVDATLPSKPGSYQFRLSASSTRLQKSGSVYLNVEVPDFGKLPLALGGIILGYGGRPRVPVADTAAANAKLPFQATLDRVFERQDEVRVICDVSRLAPTTAVTVTVDLLNEAGDAVKTLEPVIGTEPNARIDLVLPFQELTAGSYRLRVRATDGKTVATQETAFMVR